MAAESMEEHGNTRSARRSMTHAGLNGAAGALIERDARVSTGYNRA